MMNKAEIENKMHNLIGIMYETGYSSGLKERKENDQDYKDGLEDGRMEAWEAAKKIMLPSTKGGIPTYDLEDIFKYKGNEFNVLVNYSASEAIAKIKEYEEKQTDDEIKLWDEVIIKKSDYGFTDHKGVVVTIIDDGTASVMLDYRNTNRYRIDNLEKTGKSYPELENIFKQLKGDNE